MQPDTLSRRHFLKTAGLASGLLILPASVLGRDGTTAPSNRINVACVGLGGMGMADMNGVAHAGATIVGLCEVDANRLAKAQNAQRKAEAFSDYRKLFDKLGKDIDAVTVSTPDHAHFTVAMTAVSLGKHVYVQKPMCHTIDQVRRLSQAAADHKIVSQMGNQGHSNAHIRMVKEWYEAGLLGEITEVHAWSDRPIWPQGMQSFRPEAPVPAALDWDLWQGPAKARPYSPGIHPGNWRGYYEYGCGALGDMAVHSMDSSNYILELGAPTRIEVEVPGKSPVAYPVRSKITYYFPATDKRGPVKVVWRDGRGNQPPKPEGVKGLQPNGSLFIGPQGVNVMGHTGDFFEVLPASRFEQIKEKARDVPVKYPRIKGGHYRNWVDSIRKGVKASSDFSYAGPFTEVVLLGVIAQRLGRTLNWDGQAGKFIGDDEANQLIKAPAPRAGFLA